MIDLIIKVYFENNEQKIIISQYIKTLIFNSVYKWGCGNYTILKKFIISGLKNLLYIQNSYGFINPEDFDTENSDCIKVLLTFDDGFLSNKIVSDKRLS